MAHLDDDKPIADLFLDTSIMFADIVGFTKWSAGHSPNEVFKLLERLFWEFDELAVRHNVFKLGTIGEFSYASFLLNRVFYLLFLACAYASIVPPPHHSTPTF